MPTLSVRVSLSRAKEATSSRHFFCTGNEAARPAPPPPRFARYASSSGPPPPLSRGRKKRHRSRDAIAPELCHAISKNGLRSIKPEKSARFGSERFGGFMRKKLLRESGTPPLNSSCALPRTELGRSGRCGSAASNDRVGTALRAFAHPTLALFSDPQCQTATHPLVTTASPAMTTRNCIPAMRLPSGSCFTLSKKACLERTGGDVFASQDVFAPQRGRRSAERRTNGCRASMRRHSRGPISGTARLSALLRGHAPGTRLGLGRASWNHRMQTGGPSPAPVQRAPRSPARAGRADAQTA
jgi:hypothetical protein